MYKTRYNTVILGLIIIVILGCRKDNLNEIIDNNDYSDWDETTHGVTTNPDYSVVFEQNAVLRFDIKISSDNWSSMDEDLDANIGSSGGGPGGPGGGVSTVDFDPVWVPCSFNFNDTEWYNVGIRYKGNSSLISAYNSGNNKLSFKLDFDQFEEDYPAITNQRFYGFRQLNLNNNFDDASLLREKVGADLFRNFGLVSAQTAFCVVYIDYGSGPQYFGVYTIVEEVDDTVLESQLSNNNGNLYKPDGDAATFAQGTYNDDEMEKKTNEDENDYSDVTTLYEVINSSDRVNNVDQWKSNLESIFNVDQYLKWLAANTVMQNWDTYGIMSHNYYLYNNPDNEKLLWIPWDNNESLQYGKQGGALSLSLDEVGNNWPLIRYLMDDEDYEQVYRSYTSQFIADVFIPTEMQSAYSEYYNLLKDYAYTEEYGYTFLSSDNAFDMAISALNTHVQSRNNAVLLYLN